MTLAYSCAGVLLADGVADVGVPPDRIARLNFRNGDHAGHQLRMPLGADAKGAPGLRAAEIVFRDVILERTQEDIGNAVSDGDEPQRSVARSLSCQRRPALIGAEALQTAGEGISRVCSRCVPSNGSWRRQSPAKMFS